MTGILVFVATLGTTPGVVAGELVFRVVAEVACKSLANTAGCAGDKNGTG